MSEEFRGKADYSAYFTIVLSNRRLTTTGTTHHRYRGPPPYFIKDATGMIKLRIN